MKRSLYLGGLLGLLAVLAACSTVSPTEGVSGTSLHTQTVLLPGHHEPTEVTFQVRDGLAIFEGDIILGEVDENGHLLDNGLSENQVDTQAIFNDDGSRYFLWPEGVIPYSISGNWDDPETATNEHKQMLRYIDYAIDDWEDNTPIRFVPRTSEKAYVDFTRPSDEGCGATVGYRGEERHVIALGAPCTNHGTILHEIGHVVGLWHEQSRVDRDAYIDVREENIKKGREGNFKKHFTEMVGPYDYHSIMHYEAAAFAQDRASCLGENNGEPVERDINKCPIITLDPDFQDVIGTGERLSDLDIAAVRSYYAGYKGQLNSGDFGCEAAVRCELGDVNGDGLDDLVKFLKSSQSGSSQGDVYIALNNGESFGSLSKWENYMCGRSEEDCATGDFNGDGRDDILTFHKGAYGGSKEVWVALSNGVNDFYPSRKWTDGFCMLSQEKCFTGDFNGDGRDDILTFHNNAYGDNKPSAVYVYPSNGSSFYYPGSTWHSDFCRKGETCAVGDVNGDGRDDIVSFYRGPNASGDNGDVYVSLSNGSRFGNKQKWHKNICYGSFSNRCLVSDVNGDGKADLVAANTVGFNPDNPGDGSDVFVALSYGYTFGSSTKRHDSFMLSASDVVLSGKLNNDDKTDLVTISPSSNRHKMLYSQID